MNKTPAQPAKVFLVEDSAPIRSRLVSMIETLEGVSVVGEAITAASAILGIARSRPDIVLLDIHLYAGTGLDVLRGLRPTFPDMKFIVLTSLPSAQYRRICFEAGAAYFLDKYSEIEKVREIISALGH